MTFVNVRSFNPVCHDDPGFCGLPLGQFGFLAGHIDRIRCFPRLNQLGYSNATSCIEVRVDQTLFASVPASNSVSERCLEQVNIKRGLGEVWIRLRSWLIFRRLAM